jgi:FkbM family methyltransferase
MNIRGVIHAGAHLGEEALAYQNCGIRDVLWIEGNEKLLPALTDHVSRFGGHRVAHALLAEVDNDTRVFHITNNGQSSSLLEFGTHEYISPEVKFIRDDVMATKTLDRVVFENGALGYNFLNMDLQGAELLCLKGATETLAHVDYIYTEINIDEVYEDCARLQDLDAFLRDYDRVACQLAGDPHQHMQNWAGWGDALYIKREALPRA